MLVWPKKFKAPGGTLHTNRKFYQCEAHLETNNFHSVYNKKFTKMESTNAINSNGILLIPQTNCEGYDPILDNTDANLQSEGRGKK